MKDSNGAAEREKTHALRVLVVDDNLNDRGLLADFLMQRGFGVYLAADGLDGIRKARLVRPDLILMDVTMPICDGLSACRELKADPGTANIPLIFLSASVQPEERVRGLEAGAIDYITKPFQLDEVRLRLAIHLQLDPDRGDGGGNADADGESMNTPLETATSADKVFFRGVQALVRASLDSTPDVAALARAVGTSPRRLTLAFRRSAGLTVSDYMREERLREARRLLMDTALDIRSIAAKIGYSSGPNFATAFRERFGVAPSDLRQSHRMRA
ncbi:MAG TPA: DNA-binding response regulator [Paraburkholderia sp.]|jgi:DNA-binding response OmpR family regulator